MFSLNFSSAGKGPFIASKAKNVPELHFPGGGEKGSEGHGFKLAVKFRSQAL